MSPIAAAQVGVEGFPLKRTRGTESPNSRSTAMIQPRLRTPMEPYSFSDASNDTSLSIAHMTSVHSRDDVRIYHKECCALARRGYSVRLLVADGNGDSRAGGCTIIDVGRRRTRAIRFLVTTWRILGAALRESASAYHIHDPELLAVGYFLRLRRKTVIYDAHEDLPRAVLSKEWIPRVLRVPMSIVCEAVEDWLATRMSAVVAATPAIQRRFGRLMPHVTLVANYPRLADLASRGEVVERTPRICYVGGIERIRGAVAMVRAMEHVDAELDLVGPVYPSALMLDLVREPGWPRVTYHGVLPRDEAQALMRRSSIGLLLFLPEPNHVTSQPNKLFEYMGAGLPVVASDFVSWRPLIAGQACGKLVDPHDPIAIAAAIRQLLESPTTAREMGERGRSAVREHYSWESQETALLSLYESLGLYGHSSLRTGKPPPQSGAV